MLSNNLYYLLSRKQSIYCLENMKDELKTLEEKNSLSISKLNNTLDFILKAQENKRKSTIDSWKEKITQYSPFVPNGKAMYFSLDDYLLSGKEKYDASTMNPQHYANAITLINKVNQLGELINFNGQITSGYRSPERQKQIYAEKGEPPAMGSKHLSGHALDIYDPDGSLKRKILNRSVLERARDLGLYFENFGNTPTWVHIQDEAPGFTGGQIWSADNLLEKNRL